ncbi:hypothetical protein BW897_30855 [Bacillus cereus]|uniref:Uncharacterized protein n=1 Tax=Bacillus cereus TaxID=1396 RepID=A0A1S9T9P2_BACCE|nr:MULTISPECIES: hypothetical protein [Bacillus cereus group]KZD40483.1 hypothetical protein B4083_1874 [Bacillus cereus]OOR06429.1 hypothetical protein BW897_30855 [Bacillus cereus]OOR58806.1 hypothetical protein BLX04_25105 [Bacillus mycoides]PEK84768.1 hypothetical protein CN600_30730 [Bacillus mycoides]QBP90761.1 hypothetical protein E1A90_04845 [Bacillus mycoides]
MGSSVSDQVLSRSSGESYNDTACVDVKVGDHLETWKRVKIPSSVLLHNPNNIFDATIYKNDETKQIIVAFRGSWEQPIS